MATEQEEFEFRVRAEAEAAGAPARRSPKAMKIGAEGFGDAAREVLREHPIAGRLAAFANLPRQMYEGVRQAFGKEDKTGIAFTKAAEDVYPNAALAGDVATVSLASLIPGGGSVAGQALLGGAVGGAMPTEEGESRGKNIALGAITGGASSAVLKGLGLGAKALYNRSVAKAAESGAENAVRDATLAEGRKIGLVVPGSATGERGAARKAVESVAGKAALGQEASIRNQQVVNKVARAEAGLKPNEPITESTLAAARDRLSAPYREIAEMSPKAAEDLTKLKQTRADAKAQWQFYNRSADPKALKAAEALDAKAERLEGAIEREAGRLGAKGMKSDYAKAAGKAAGLEKGSDLVSRLRDARKALAKNYQVEKAVNLGNGNVDAAVIGKMYDKAGEKGMTGGLATIGKFQQAFPDFMRSKPSTQVAPGIGALKPYAAALGLGIGAEQAHERLGLSPYMMGAAALPLLGGPARSIALSKLMQGAPAYAPGIAPRAANYLTSGDLPRRLIPLSAVPLAAELSQ